MSITITPAQIRQIAPMARNCDSDALNQAVREVEIFDMERIFGLLWNDIAQNWNSTEEKWKELLDGSTFDCDGKQKSHHGVKLMIKYYVYSRYLLINGFSDTPNGSVSKTNPFSMPKSLNEVESFSNKYRRMAKELYDQIFTYLCVNKELFTNFDFKDCQNCGCNEDVKIENVSGTGFTTKTISKWDV